MNTTHDRLNNTAILILGMHRSGTSATTGVLHYLGVDLGSDLMPPGPDNPKGFFEHNGITVLHDELLNALGSSWDDPRVLPDDWATDQRVAPFRQRLTAIILRDFIGKPLWALKDPRLCRLLPLWVPMLRNMGINIKALLVVRDPAEVAASLSVRNGMPPVQALDLWIGHMLLAERDTRNLPRTLLFYEDLLLNWKQEMERVMTELELPLIINEATVRSVGAFLTDELRHHRWPKLECSNLPQFDWAQGIFNAFRLWRMKNLDPKCKLDELMAEWQHAQCCSRSVASYFLTLVNTLQAEVQETRAQLRECAHQLEDVNATLRAITSSRGWRLLVFLWRIRSVLVPHGSLRARIMGIFVKGFEIFLLKE